MSLVISNKNNISSNLKNTMLLQENIKQIRLIFFNWDSLHARMNNHYEAWSHKKKKKRKRLEDTGNLLRKNLQLKMSVKPKLKAS